MSITRKASLVCIAIAAVLGGVWLLLQSRGWPPKPAAAAPAEKPALKSPVPPPAVANQQPSSIPTKPKMFKAKNYPPTTPEQKAMWDWWTAMEHADRDFQWKMPIDFYGKVIDQFGEPVAGAKVTLIWSAMGGTQGKEVFTRNDGKFELTDAKGKGVSVEILKDGYLRTKASYGSFEYAAFFEDNFHVPDRGKPVIFRLQKLTAAEPMYKFSTTGRVLLDGTPLMLNVATGKTGTGDLSFSIQLGTGRGAGGPDYTLTVQGNGGAALVLSSDEFLFSAPESGYQNVLTLKQVATDPNYRDAQKLRFYVKTSAAKYAAVQVEIDIREKTQNAGFFAIVYYNPSGSRNLEFDHRKWLNP